MITNGHCEAAIDFIERIKGIDSLERLALEAQREVRMLGFKNFILAKLQLGLGETFKDAVLASTLPSRFVEEYSNRNLVTADPMAARLVQGNFPVIWHNETLKASSELELDLIILRRLQSIEYVCAIPIHGPGNYHGCFAATGLDREVTAEELNFLHLIGQYTYAIADNLKPVHKKKSRELTLREREVLHWISHGKSAWEIGRILEISRRTVNEHTQSIFTKLNAVKREQAVAIAAKEQLI